MKILNVEAGYGLESSVYPESVPIRTSLETLAQDSRDRGRQSLQQQLHFESISRFDAPRYHPGVVRGSDLSRPFHAVTTPPSSVSFAATRSIGHMWNIKNVKSLHPVERNRSSKQGKSRLIFRLRVIIFQLFQDVNTFNIQRSFKLSKYRVRRQKFNIERILIAIYWSSLLRIFTFK